VKLEFSVAKNGEKTCSLNGKYLCSAYNPTREAESFVNSITTDISPSVIFIIEPCLSYIEPFLRTRFPESKLVAINILSDFEGYNNKWDSTVTFSRQFGIEEELYLNFTEEELCTSVFYEWRPFCQIFQEETTLCWNGIKKALTRSRDVLVTRSYFAARWIKNTVKFLKTARFFFKLNKTHKPVVITASGPSLTSSIEQIKSNRKKFSLIAVSSSLSVLNHHDITPDFVISTDGGYWASRHLDFPANRTKNRYYAIAPEGNISSKILETDFIIPLTYEDGFEKLFSDTSDFTEARRNGTVSGTAAELALKLTDSEIYFCGLDLHSEKGFQHSQPNALELLNRSKDNRKRTAYTRQASSEFSDNHALNIYFDWFNTFSLKHKKRIFRLSDNYDYKNTFAGFDDVNWEYFENKNYPEIEHDELISKEAVQSSITENTILQKIKDLESSDTLDKIICPLEHNVMLHSKNNEEIEKIKNNIQNKRRKLLNSLYCLVQKA